MRPINLKIKGINSYVTEQTVDFEKLSENNLFGIFGETGSGKTTILDAIIMALYGTSDRDVTQNIINVNTSDAYIIFEFEMIEGGDKKVRYLVRRDYKIRPSGLKTDAIITNRETGLVLAEHSDEVNEKILQIIRIAKKEFQKCIALPQGEFDRFLLDTPTGRKRTIAKLFNLESFGVELNEKLKSRKEKVTLKKLNLEDKVALYKNISQDNLDLITNKLIKRIEEKINIEFMLNNAKLELAEVNETFERKQKLTDINLQLNLKRSEQKDIDFLKKQIEFTKKYGEYLVINEKYDNTISEIDRINNLLIELKTNLNSIDGVIKQKQKEKENLLYTKLEVEKLVKATAQEFEKRKAIEKQIAENETNISIFIKDCEVAKSKLDTTLKNRDKNLIEMNETKSEYKTNVAKLNQITDELDDINTILTSEFNQNFCDFLDDLKGEISSESLNEIAGLAIFDEIQTILTKIEEYKEDARLNKETAARKSKQLQDVEDLQSYKINLERQKDKLNKQLLVVEDKIKKLSQDGYLLEIDSTTLQTQIINLTNQMQNMELSNAENDIILNDLANEQSVENVTKHYNNACADYDNKQKEIDEKFNEKQQIVIDIEVNTSVLQNCKIKLNELKDVLKLFNIGKEIRDESKKEGLLLDNYEIVDANKKIDEYSSSVNYLEQTAKELTESLVGIRFTNSTLKNAETKVQMLEKQSNDINLVIGLLENNVEEQKKNLDMVTQMKEELVILTSQLNAVLDLQELLSGGALLEYVSEEYMYLITEFANKYVYRISKGKYFLKYNGDFSVLDNFNGGIARGVKTLSGGERFIISLSLALGISQSIATNNNQNFNFFFIDEGFGSLSDNYVEKVLQSFEALIRLDFTVGFITHVEKMQSYITNRVVVVKESNERGSKIIQNY